MAQLSQYRLFGSKTYDAPSMATGVTGAPTTVSVPGAALGDFVQASLDIDQAGVILQAYVSAADTVAVYPRNTSGGTVDLASATLRVVVTKAGF
jgi:hypothetical protein